LSDYYCGRYEDSACKETAGAIVKSTLIELSAYLPLVAYGVAVAISARSPVVNMSFNYKEILASIETLRAFVVYFWHSTFLALSRFQNPAVFAYLLPRYFRVFAVVQRSVTASWSGAYFRAQLFSERWFPGDAVFSCLL